MLAFWKLVNLFLCTARIKAHFEVLLSLKKHVLHYTAFYMADGESRIAISDGSASEYVGDDWYVGCHIANIAVPEVCFVEASASGKTTSGTRDGLIEETLLTLFISDLWDNHGCLEWFVASTKLNLSAWKLRGVSAAEVSTFRKMGSQVGLHLSHYHISHVHYSGSRRPDLQFRYRWGHAPHTRLNTGVLLVPAFLHTGTASCLIASSVVSDSVSAMTSLVAYFFIKNLGTCRWVVK